MRHRWRKPRRRERFPTQSGRRSCGEGNGQLSRQWKKDDFSTHEATDETDEAALLATEAAEEETLDAAEAAEDEMLAAEEEAEL
jgi:hypothetical protein